VIQLVRRAGILLTRSDLIAALNIAGRAVDRRRELEGMLAAERSELLRRWKTADHRTSHRDVYSSILFAVISALSSAC